MLRYLDEAQGERDAAIQKGRIGMLEHRALRVPGVLVATFKDDDPLMTGNCWNQSCC